MSNPDLPAATPSPALVLALRRVLRPLVKLMLARGITFPYFAELLKKLFVEVAAQDFRIGVKPATDSRINLVTGVHRKDVSRLRQSIEDEPQSVPSVVSLGAQLVALWMGSSQYLDEAGQPRALPRFFSEGGAISFEGLVASVNSDIRSRVVLDEWMRLGVVGFDEEKRICLNTQAFVPTDGFDEKAFYFGHNLHDHAAAAVHNLTGTRPPFMERSVHYNELSAASVELLAKAAQEQGMKALVAINKSAMAAEVTDKQGNAAGQRMTFGVYFYSAPVDAQRLGVGAVAAHPVEGETA